RADLEAAIAPGDVVILHDPQTLGLAPHLRRHGAEVIWSCHIGADVPNDLARSAWHFLRPYVEETAAQVFSRRAYAWDGLAAEDVAVIPPCIDAFSPKNQALAQDQVDSILRVAGLVPGEGDGANGDATFERQDGTPGMVHIEA